MATQVKTGLIANNAITDAKIANVALTGVTASSGDSSTSLATTAFVAGEINTLIDSAPGALNTLNELAAAMGDDANFSTTVTNSIAGKLPLDGSGTMTGHILLNNAIELRSKDTGGTVKTIARINNSNELEYGWSGNGPVKFMGGGAYTERMRIHTDGNVGIGSNNPGEKLVIKGDGARMTVESDDYEVAMLGRRGSSGTALDQGYLRLRDQGVTANGVVIDTNGSSWFNGGNVGVGTTAPQAKLSVKTALSQASADLRAIDIVVPGSWSLSGNAGYTSDITWTNAEASGYIMGKFGLRYSGTATGGNSEFVFKDMYQGGYASSADIMYLGSNGYVGIPGRLGVGISSPSAPLHIQTNDSTTNSAVNSLMITNLSTGTTTTGFGGEIRFQAERNNGVNQNTGGIRSIAEVNSGSDISSGMAFDTSLAGVNSEALRITKDGNALLRGGKTSDEVYMDIFSDSGSNRGAGYFRFLTDGSSAEQSVAQIYMEQGSGDGGSRKCNMYFQVSDNGAPSTALTIENNKIATFAGDVRPSTDNAKDLGASNLRWRNIYTGDLHLSNEGSTNDVDGTSGNWTIQEGNDDLFIINNKTGKRFKFSLEEVE